MSALDQYLRKLGVDSYLRLNEEERKTFKAWQQALAGRRITDDDVQKFMGNQLEDAIKKITSLKLGKRDDTFLKMKIEFIRNIQNFLNAPVVERKVAEAALGRAIEALP